MILSTNPNISIKDSLLARLGLAMGTIAFLSFISMALSTSIADNSLGKANAINLAGSLRMMSYRLLSYAESQSQENDIGKAVTEFQTRLETLEGFVVLRAADYSELPARFSQVQKHWTELISPALLSLQSKPSATIVRQL